MENMNMTTEPTTPSVVRHATGKADEAHSHKLLLTFPDGGTCELGGKRAARAAGVVMTRDERGWGYWGTSSDMRRLTTDCNRAAEVMDEALVVYVTEAGAVAR